MRSLVLVPLFLFIQNCECFAQTDSNRIGIGLNFGTLYSGTPELQCDFFFGKTFGIALAGGYTYKPKRGGIAVDDLADLIELHGGFYKIGLKTRFSMNRSWLWIDGFYVGSWYNEYGEVGRFDTTGNIIYSRVRNTGYVNGVALAAGVDLKVYRNFFIRLGYQRGYYKRDDDLGKPFLTLQPGFGAACQQFILGVSFLTGMKH